MEGLRAMRPKGSKVITPGPALAQIGQPILFPPGASVAQATHTLYRTMEKMRDAIHHRAHSPSTQDTTRVGASMLATSGAPQSDPSRPASQVSAS
jgi:hypothetical protein